MGTWLPSKLRYVTMLLLARLPEQHGVHEFISTRLGGQFGEFTHGLGQLVEDHVDPAPERGHDLAKLHVPLHHKANITARY
jgi:hypothetical protein